MEFYKSSVVVFFLVAVITSCNKKLLVNRKYIVENQKGIMVFIDAESRKNRTFGTGDVFNDKDSLIPDFFLPYNFSKNIITKEDIDNALLLKQNHKVSFLYLLRDCNESDRKSSIERDCIPLFLEKNIDEYLHSNKIYAQPVEIEFIRSNIDRDYYEIHKSLTIKYKGKFLNLMFNKGSYEILRTNVLEYDWK